MKKSLSIIIIISILSALFLSVNVSAESTVTVDGVKYEKFPEYCAVVSCSTSVSGTLTIPSTVEFNGSPVPVTEISSYAFKNCKSLTGLVLPEGLIKIGSYAFDGSGVQNVNIPKSVSEIENFAFAYCVYLASITVNDGNEYFSSDDGVLFNKEKTVLLAYPSEYEANYTVPSGVTSIASGAFAGCTGLRRVVISGDVASIGAYAFRDCSGITGITMMRGVETIGTYAFYSCKSLATVIMPDTLTAIEDGAFAWCVSLTKAYFVGTSDRWNNVTVGTYNDNMTKRLIYHTKHVYDDSKDVYCNTCGYDRSKETTYTVTFKYYDGKVLSSKTYFYGDTVEIPDGPSRDADNTYTYTFKDWGKTVAGTCEGSAEYTAQYDSVYIDYTVVFKNYDGTQLSSKTYHYGDDVEIPQNVKRSADNTYTYTFKGWDKEVATKCAGSAEYKAEYDSVYIDYTVVFKNYDGTQLSSKTYHYGDDVEIPQNVKRSADNTYTYTFKGWDKEVATKCAGSAEYKAVYEGKYIDYTVVFKNYDGTQLSSKTYHYGDDVEVPQNVKRSADNTYTYTFKGWDKEVATKCAGSAEYKAVYEGKYIDYTVVFKNYDGTQLSSKTYHYGDDVEIPQNVKRSADNTYTYTFKGWDKEVAAKCAGSAEYKAEYDSVYIDYTVVFKNYDGTELSSKTYHYGDDVEIPQNVKRSADNTYTYTFKGWDKEVVTKCAGSAEYKAVYEGKYIDYTVTFKDHDGTQLSSKTYHYGDDVEVPQNLKRDADNTYTYTFKGWDKEVAAKCAGSAEYKAEYDSVYIDYTVVFKNYDGTQLSSKTYHYGDKVEVPAEPTRKEDDKNTYKFKEWDKDVDPFCKGDAEYKAVYSATEKTVDPEGTDPEGKDPEGKDPEGKDPEGKDPEGKDPEGKDPEGKDPEGKDPEGKDPEGKDPEGKDPEGKDPEGKDPEGKDPEETKPGKRIKGDMNGDNEANNLDLVFLFKYVSDNEKSDDESVYDFYEDGEVNNKDVVSLFRYVSSI